MAMLIRNLPSTLGPMLSRGGVTGVASHRFSHNLAPHQSAPTSSYLSYQHYIAKEPLVYRNIGQQLERTVVDYGQNEAVVSCSEGIRLTFQEVLQEADRIAIGFNKIGLQRGDFIGIWGPNTVTWYLTMMAAARAGLVSVVLNPAYQAAEIEYCLKKVKVKAVVAPEVQYKTTNYYEILRTICPEMKSCHAPALIQSENLPHLKAVILDSPSKLPGTIQLDHLRDEFSTVDRSALSRLQNQIGPDNICNIQFTSGTTGQPKASMLSHYNFVNNGIHVAKRFGYENERICVQVPLFHAYGTVISIMAALAAGATMVLPEKGFRPEASLRAIINEECTIIHGTPTMYVDIIKKQKELQLPLTTVKTAVTGGAPCSPHLFKEIKAALNLKNVRTVYGLTESTAVIFQSMPGESDEKVFNTVGHIQDHIEAKVIAADGATVPFGTPGELCIRGYCTMLGYFEDEAKTREVIGNDNWLHTGDQFIMHPDGYGQIVGRLKDIIIRGGENIFPKEVEDFLNTHPDIIESHVIGVPDERFGEEVCAYVRLVDGVKELLPASVKSFGQDKIAHFKIPRYIVPITDFPKTTSGKIQKFVLRQMYEKVRRGVEL